jgi:26S proteasome regulatory subunit N5
MLSNIKKSQGKPKEAAEILCELQVETFGSMARREKTEFILHQVELCIENGDFMQAGILSRKIGTKFFARRPIKTPEQLETDRVAREEAEKKRSADDPPVEKEDDVTDLKLKYYEQQITLAKQDDKYLEVCKHYRQVLDTESVEENPERLRAALQRVIYFVLLAQYDNEQNDLLHRIQQDSRISQVPEEAALLKLFTLHELMRWPMVDEQFGPHVCSTDIFSKTKSGTGTSAQIAEEDKAHTRYVALQNRVIEHNVRVIARYYTRITFPRLTALLDLSEAETEKYISDLVCKKTVYARIDRPARIVNFEMQRGPDEVLDEWSSSMKSLLGLLERVGHLMQKEEMMARIRPGAPAKGKRSGVEAR